MLIFMIGMPGSGKSTLGKQLADRLEWGFLDLDELIEQTENKSITQIFSENGEEYFRKLEKEKLRAILDVEGDIVISCGGGTPCFFDNMRKMNESGITVFLDVSTDTLSKRVENRQDRPLLTDQPQEKLEQLYKERLNYYQQAELRLSEKAITIDRLLQLLRKYLT